ncbi:MAG: serine--tRNA ligase [Chlamydiota bacterium]|nr:serine--tRNA ligase [Chlamydiota bacterium]
MLDIKEIRKNPEECKEKILSKDPTANIDVVLNLDGEIRELKAKVENLKAKRNEYSKKIGDKKRNGEDASELMEEVSSISKESHDIDAQLSPLEEKFTYELSKLPNYPMDDIKVSPDPADNVFIKEWGKKTEFDFEIKNHLELNEKLQLFDFERGAKISGSGWPVYRNMGARLEWALINYMIDTHIQNGYMQWMPPALVREESLYGSGQLPKFRDQQYKLSDEDYNLWLIPTAEVPLNYLHGDEILSETDLPKKYAAYTPCFRREAGAAGKGERGLIRMHQFNKVEMFCFAKPEESMTIFNEMVASAEKILEGLGLHYRSMLLCTGDMSFSGARTIDIETWLPGQEKEGKKAYYEVSSVSNCSDFQARRSNIRFRRGNDKPEFVHTLNGSGLATSRLMVALLENNQNADGSVNIPPALSKYLGGITKLEPEI